MVCTLKGYRSLLLDDQVVEESLRSNEQSLSFTTHISASVIIKKRVTYDDPISLKYIGNI